MFRTLPAVVALVAAAAVFSCARPSNEPVQLALESAVSAIAAGLDPAETSSLSSANLSNDAWSRVFRVSVNGDTTPIAGKYSVSRGRLQFVPAFPLDEGREYLLVLSYDHMPGRRHSGTLIQTRSLPVTRAAAATRVVRISPTIDTWPANLLRCYLYFSSPMSDESGVGKIQLRASDGAEVPDVFLPVEADFWSPDHTRYTAFFDPGRVKRGILPNRQLGRALIAGRRYSIEVSADWRDAQGRPLAAAFVHEFQAGPAIERALRVEDWTLSAPAAGTRDPIVVAFPWSIDRALAERALSIVNSSGALVRGTSLVEDGELKWSLTPDAAWTAGKYRLVAAPVLEDPAGNQIGRAFEVDMKRGTPPGEAARTLAFHVAPPPARIR